MFLVGLTGGIGSGKSTVAKIFQQLECPIIDADLIAREVVEIGKPAWRKIKERFGQEVLNEDGTINRERLAEIVFADDTKRRLLNSITHPEISKIIFMRVFMLFITGHQFVIVDVPLLFESGKMVPYMNTTVVVYCDRPTQIDRLCSQRGYTVEQALKRIDAQMPLAKKRAMATHVIDNMGSVTELKDSVTELHAHLIASKAQWKARAAAVFAFGLLVLATRVLYKSINFIFSV